MQQLAKDEQNYLPIGSKIILRDFYVDDMISGGDSLEEVNEIKLQTANLLGRGKFKIRKWCSNDLVLWYSLLEHLCFICSASTIFIKCY